MLIVPSKCAAELMSRSLIGAICLWSKFVLIWCSIHAPIESTPVFPRWSSCIAKVFQIESQMMNQNKPATCFCRCSLMLNLNGDTLLHAIHWRLKCAKKTQTNEQSFQRANRLCLYLLSQQSTRQKSNTRTHWFDGFNKTKKNRDKYLALQYLDAKMQPAKFNLGVYFRRQQQHS